MESTPRWRIGIAAGVLLVAGAAGGALLTQAADAGAGATTSLPAITPIASQQNMLVDVQGAVAEPGVYALPEDARVLDALARAGGATPEGDTSALNLAQPLTDGMQLVVPVEGEVPAAGSGGDGGLVSINRADADELDELPGVGPAIAAAIIAYRDDVGVFGSVAELEQVPGIGPAMMAKLEPLVTL